MRFINFILLLFRKGSIQHSPIDFEQSRRKILQDLLVPEEFLTTSIPKNKILYTLKSNLSYLLRSRKMNTMFFISTQKQLIYVRILKAASTSILKAFLPLVNSRFTEVTLTDDQIDAISFRYVKHKLFTPEQQYQKFTVIRSPLQRIVSVYMDLFDPDAVHFSYDSYWFGILKKGMSFSEFVDVISMVPESLKGPHFSSQYYILSKGIGLMNVRWFRIEKDYAALEEFLFQNGISLHVQNKQKKTYDYRTFYTEDILKKVSTMYKKDIDLFGYQQEIQELKNFLRLQE